LQFGLAPAGGIALAAAKPRAARIEAATIIVPGISAGGGGAVPAEQTPSVGCSIKWKAGREPDWA